MGKRRRVIQKKCSEERKRINFSQCDIFDKLVERGKSTYVNSNYSCENCSTLKCRLGFFWLFAMKAAHSIEKNSLVE